MREIEGAYLVIKSVNNIMDNYHSYLVLYIL